jgi:hypothetical protein
VDEVVWVANFTGDPDAPAKVPLRQYNVHTKRYELVQVDNPFYAAKDIVRQMDGGMQEYNSQDGLLAKNLPPLEVRVPAYKRRPLPKHIAEWSLRRDSNSLPEFRGQLRRSRPPTSFEPTMDWGLDDMRAYLALIDPKAILGPGEAELKSQCQEGSRLVERKYSAAIQEAQITTMQRLHFRLANPQVKLYGRQEFEEFRNGFEKPEPQVTADEIEKSIRKNLGGGKPTSANA